MHTTSTCIRNMLKKSLISCKIKSLNEAADQIIHAGSNMVIINDKKNTVLKCDGFTSHVNLTAIKLNSNTCEVKTEINEYYPQQQMEVNFNITQEMLKFIREPHIKIPEIKLKAITAQTDVLEQIARGMAGQLYDDYYWALIALASLVAAVIIITITIYCTMQCMKKRNKEDPSTIWINEFKVQLEKNLK